MKLGIDIDGVLANFTDSCAKLITRKTGVKFPKASDEWPTVWSWEKVDGVTPDHMDKVWEIITQKDSTFWKDLDPLPGITPAMKRLDQLSKQGHDVTFFTHRMGHRAKAQTEEWLYANYINYPCVILSGNKTPLIKLLDITFFIDDKPSTIEDLYQTAERERWYMGDKHFYLKDTPYNKLNRRPEVRIATSIQDALEKAGLW